MATAVSTHEAFGLKPNGQSGKGTLWMLILAAILLKIGFGAERNGNTAARGIGSDPRQTIASRADDRGRWAESPSQIPAKGWKDVLIRVWHKTSEQRLVLLAAGVTFYAILAIFPAIAALVSIFGLFADPASIQEQLNSVSDLLPGGALDIIRDEIARITSQRRSSLGASFVIGLGISLWSANAGVKAIFDVLNVVYGEEEKRGFIKLNAISLAFTLAGILLVILVFAGVAVLPLALSYLALGGWAGALLRLLRWPLLFLFVAAAIAILYRYGPSRTRARWRWITWGSAFAALVWLIGSMLFTWYVGNFGSYNRTYGSLGAVIGFMTWIWISTIVILMGAEIDAELESQTARDTTEGPERQIGTRGARVADTVGEAKAA